MLDLLEDAWTNCCVPAFQLVLQRLEAETAAQRAALSSEADQRAAAVTEKSAAEIRELKRSEARIADKFRTVATAHKAAEERLAELRAELDSKNSTIKFLESQVCNGMKELYRFVGEV